MIKNFLFLFVFICMISSVFGVLDYVTPTPVNNINYGGTSFTIRIEDTQNTSSWFNVTINGVSYQMTNLSSTIWEYTSPSNYFSEITNVTYNVSYSGLGVMETRTFTYYPDYTNSILSSYGFASFFISIISIIFLFFNLNFKKNRSKKGISDVITIVSLLLVTVTTGVIVNSWYQDFSTSYQTKKLGSVANANSFEIVGIQNESDIFSVYINSKGSGYSLINSIEVNDIDCTLNQGNVLFGNSINKIYVECSNILSINNYVVVSSKNAIFSANKPLISIVYSPCSLVDQVQLNHNQNFSYYNSSSVPYTQSCSYQLRICNDGTLSGNSSYNYSSCFVTPQDITPDAFNFTNQSGRNFSAIITSNTLTPTGYEGSVSVGITGNGTPQLSVAGGAWTTSTTITLGQNITIRLNSASSELTTSIATLTLGNYSVNFSVITRAYDLTPDAFNFTNQTNVSISTLITSNTLTPIGYDFANVSIQGYGSPQLSINGGAWVTNSTITFGQNISIRLNSSYAINTTKIAQLNFGTYSVNWSVTTGVPLIEYLIVAGGGGGGTGWNVGWNGGGGGAGGLLQGNMSNITIASYNITIGNGGLANGNGSNSSFNSLISVGGGAGGTPFVLPSSGGSGGGAAGGGANLGGVKTVGQGYDGGSTSGCNAASGGGGAGGVGIACSNGGPGLAINITGTLTNYSKGGQGVTSIANSGNGGNGGNSGNGWTGQAGDAGVVVLRYLGAQVATGGTITSVGGYTIHKFTANGTFQFITNDTSMNSNIIFINVTGATMSSLVVSNNVLYNPFGTITNISIVGNGTPQFSIDGSAWSNSSVINPGQYLTLRLNTSSTINSTSYVTLTLGNSSYNWSVTTGVPVIEYLIVAGGGSGGHGWNVGYNGGGGGAGGLLQGNMSNITIGSYTVIVGTSGAYVNGSNSSFNGLRSIGGGRGGTVNADQQGNVGGSGGGACGGGAGSGSAGTAGQGYDGGSTTGSGSAAGGGGAGGSGFLEGDGGPGLAINITGTLTNYSKGGKGVTSIANSGNGGNGGNSGNGWTGQAGDAGVVVLRYLGAQIATGGTITSVGGYTIHKFTANGTFTVS